MKNNGPRPPWTDDEILRACDTCLSLVLWCVILRYVLVSAYTAYRVYNHIPI